ncbi:hypothetical protein [Nocardia sp. NPDC004722]
MHPGRFHGADIGIRSERELFEHGGEIAVLRGPDKARFGGGGGFGPEAERILVLDLLCEVVPISAVAQYRRIVRINFIAIAFARGWQARMPEIIPAVEFVPGLQ